jgi:hypothetical protein
MAAEADRASDAALERQVLLKVWAISVGFMLAVFIVNVLTLVTEAERLGAPFDAGRFWVLEGTSTLVLLLLFPGVAIFERRHPFTPETWRVALVWHIGGSLVFSLAHVLGMEALRLAILGLPGDASSWYAALPADLLYEYRKDLLSYGIFVLILGFARSLEEHRREAAAARRDARATGRLTLKSGGRTLYLDAETLESANAAGNYVEISAGDATHLARMSLSALEDLLREAGVDVVRVHRSYLVNRRKVREVVPGGDGDFRLLMQSGAGIKGSRRFRHKLSPGSSPGRAGPT